MRTNLVLDSHLVQEAFRYTTVSTKRALVDLALREFVANHRRLDLRDLPNQILLSDDYDYKLSRRNTAED